MIDFRYHLVSLASVLIALAVGIVLGAGPLNSGILESVNNEVKTLRADKADLRTQLDAVTNSVDLHQSFEAARLPDLVAGKLEGRQVVVVALPGAPAGSPSVMPPPTPRRPRSPRVMPPPRRRPPTWPSPPALSPARRCPPRLRRSCSTRKPRRPRTPRPSSRHRRRGRRRGRPCRMPSSSAARCRRRWRRWRWS